MGSKYSLLMTFGQFMSYYERKIHQKILQKLRPENLIQALLCLQRTKHNLLENEVFEASYLY